MDQTPKYTKEVIYLPSFNITRCDKALNPFEEIKILNLKDEETNVAKVSQQSHLNFNHSPDHLVFEHNPNSQDVVIKKDFVVALINYEILSELHIPVISTFVVRKENFIQKQ